jgi:hypothetical protein
MYQICIRGRVTVRFGSAFEGMRVQAGAAESVFTGEIHDQSKLYGLLDRIRDLGLELLSLQPPPAADQPTDDKETTRWPESSDRGGPMHSGAAADCVVPPNRHGAAAPASIADSIEALYSGAVAVARHSNA